MKSPGIGHQPSVLQKNSNLTQYWKFQNKKLSVTWNIYEWQAYTHSQHLGGSCNWQSGIVPLLRWCSSHQNDQGRYHSHCMTHGHWCRQESCSICSMSSLHSLGMGDPKDSILKLLFEASIKNRNTHLFMLLFNVLGEIRVHLLPFLYSFQ